MQQSETLAEEKIDIRSLLRNLARSFCDTSVTLFNDVLLVSVQHILETTVDMLLVMKELGLKDAIICGKKYSTHSASAEKISDLGFTYIPDGYQLGYGRFDGCMQESVYKVWFKALEKLEQKKYSLMIILDDGADLLRATPGSFFHSLTTTGIKNRPNLIIGIEQTRGGSNRPTFQGFPFPIINVAGAFCKTEIEYPYVANLVVKKILILVNKEIIPEIYRPPVIGVIGYGSMGQAITNKLLTAGFDVIVYDKDNNKINSIYPALPYDNASILISNADVIIGCTGKDITYSKANLSAFLYSRTKKWLVSTGSKDREFNALLRMIQSEAKGLGYAPDPLRTINYENHAGGTINILRGGFPINFDNTAHSVSPKFIWPTRASLLLACLTAIKMRKSNEKMSFREVGTFMLPPKAQLLIIKKYLEMNPKDKFLTHLMEMPDTILLDHIIKNSEGNISRAFENQ